MAYRSDFDVKVQPFKAWLAKRQKQARRDAIDALAKRLTVDGAISKHHCATSEKARLRTRA